MLPIEQKAGFHSHATIKLDKSLGKSQHESEVYTPNKIAGSMGTLRNAAASH